MEASDIARLRGSPALSELAARRRTLSWGLAMVMMAIYGGFLILVAFCKAAVAQPIGQGPLTLAFPLGLGVIASAVALTGFYVVRANAVFDRLTAQIVASCR